MTAQPIARAVYCNTRDADEIDEGLASLALSLAHLRVRVRAMEGATA